MCEDWSFWAKLIEFVGAILLIVPLYKTAFEQSRYVAVLGRKILSTDVEPLTDSLAAAEKKLAEKVVVRSSALGMFEIIVIVFGGLGLLFGGGMELIERSHKSEATCAAVSNFFPEKKKS